MASLIDLSDLTTFYTQVLEDLSAYTTYEYLSSSIPEVPTLQIMVSSGPGGSFEVHNPLSNSVTVTAYMKYDGASPTGSVSKTNYDTSSIINPGSVTLFMANSGRGYYSFKFYSEDGAVSEVVSELY